MLGICTAQHTTAFVKKSGHSWALSLTCELPVSTSKCQCSEQWEQTACQPGEAEAMGMGKKRRKQLLCANIVDSSGKGELLGFWMTGCVVQKLAGGTGCQKTWILVLALTCGVTQGKPHPIFVLTYIGKALRDHWAQFTTLLHQVCSRVTVEISGVTVESNWSNAGLIQAFQGLKLYL